MSQDSARTFLDRLLDGSIRPPVFATNLGLEPGEFGVGTATFTMATDPSRHGNVMGTLHGGALATLADTAMGFAFATTLVGVESFATLEMKVSFLRPVWSSTLTATAHVVHRGKTTGLVECRVTDERGRLIAHATSTCLMLSGSQADGRRLGDSRGG
ncbi:MAG: PaaI family thioesterase [Gemmatimonadota bacterium]|nr:PaaI family thioesterase [Gemmatimonadota bacterium]